MNRSSPPILPADPLGAAADLPEREVLADLQGPSALIADLNRMLADEQGCAIRYATHAVLVEGPFTETVSRRLQEIAGDEALHAARLRERIRALGGLPTMEAHVGSPSRFLSLAEILDVNLREERAAIERYRRLLDIVPRSEVRLRRTLEDILVDEEEHREELEALKPRDGAACPCMQGHGGPRLPEGAGSPSPETHRLEWPRL